MVLFSNFTSDSHRLLHAHIHTPVVVAPGAVWIQCLAQGHSSMWTAGITDFSLRNK